MKKKVTVAGSWAKVPEGGEIEATMKGLDTVASVFFSRLVTEVPQACRARSAQPMIFIRENPMSTYRRMRSID